MPRGAASWPLVPYCLWDCVPELPGSPCYLRKQSLFQGRFKCLRNFAPQVILQGLDGIFRASVWGQLAEGWLKCLWDLTKRISPVLHLSWGSCRTSAVFKFTFFGLGTFSGFSWPEQLLEQRVLV